MDCHREYSPVVIIGIHGPTKDNRHLPNKTQRNNEKNKTKLKEIVEKSTHFGGDTLIPLEILI